MAEPWERQPGESSKAFAAFRVFRDLGPRRSVAEAYRQKTGRVHARQASGNWNAVATRWLWQERARAWDDEQDRVRREKQLAAQAEMGERHATVALLMQQRLIERLQGLDASDLSPADVARWLEAAVKVERQARGVEPAGKSLNLSVDQPDGGRVVVQLVEHVVDAGDAGPDSDAPPAAAVPE